MSKRYESLCSKYELDMNKMFIWLHTLSFMINYIVTRNNVWKEKFKIGKIHVTSCHSFVKLLEILSNGIINKPEEN